MLINPFRALTRRLREYYFYILLFVDFQIFLFFCFAIVLLFNFSTFLLCAEVNVLVDGAQRTVVKGYWAGGAGPC